MSKSQLEADTIYILKEDEVYLRVFAEPGIMEELIQHFTFDVPGARFMPSYKAHVWDGKIRLLDRRTNRLYYGLVEEIEKFSNSREYTLIKTGVPEVKNSPELKKFVFDFIDSLNLHSQGKKIVPHDFQREAIYEAIQSGRKLIVSPTASGKSLIIYCLLRWYQNFPENKTLLVVVPTTSLVEQMYTDFEDYSSHNKWNVSKKCHRIYAGHDKTTTKPIIISTWQSIYDFGKPWFKDINMIVGDEAHGFAAESLKKIMANLVNCPYRFGTTGTVQDTKVHHLVLQGLFGGIFVAATTKELIDKNIVSDLLVKCIVLNYDEATRKFCKGLKYPDEINYLITNKKRNRFIRDLVLQLQGNTLVLFTRVDHGKELYKLVSEKTTKKRKVFLIYGLTETEERENIRAITEKEDDAIIIASFGTFSTGINIRRLHNTVAGSPVKSAIRNKQAIGRGLRKGDDKKISVFYDIGDNLEYKNNKNFAWKHFMYRMGIYKNEQFKQKMYNFEI